MVVDQVLVPSRETGVAPGEDSSGTNGTDGRDGHRGRDESRFKGGTISVDGFRNAVPPAKPRPSPSPHACTPRGKPRKRKRRNQIWPSCKLLLRAITGAKPKEYKERTGPINNPSYSLLSTLPFSSQSTLLSTTTHTRRNDQNASQDEVRYYPRPPRLGRHRCQRPDVSFLASSVLQTHLDVV